ncbi:hypothetical protein AWC29_25870 [Mycobacterium triplex]|uniref:Uncharacterized protein n=1 Tax=Mycobacterium triplex TaxID=47839 RepID=A0ABX3VYK5_9MYCO|nr:lipoprotein LpqH [Mycobacterium triplex]ORW99796.1 hypothetical protein AWC29_25870 [Mycobacterium triplex]
MVAAAALVVGGSAGCSSKALAEQAPGTLPPGAAQVTIDGNELPRIQSVQCPPPERHLRTIIAGNDESGATVMVSNAGKLNVEFIRIRNLNGFSGDYNRGLAASDASIALNDNTYQIAGTAVGYGPDSPERTTTRFTIKVSC